MKRPSSTVKRWSNCMIVGVVTSLHHRRARAALAVIQWGKQVESRERSRHPTPNIVERRRHCSLLSIDRSYSYANYIRCSRHVHKNVAWCNRRPATSLVIIISIVIIRQDAAAAAAAMSIDAHYQRIDKALHRNTKPGTMKQEHLSFLKKLVAWNENAETRIYF